MNGKLVRAVLQTLPSGVRGLIVSDENHDLVGVDPNFGDGLLNDLGSQQSSTQYEWGSRQTTGEIVEKHVHLLRTKVNNISFVLIA